MFLSVPNIIGFITKRLIATIFDIKLDHLKYMPSTLNIIYLKRFNLLKTEKS